MKAYNKIKSIEKHCDYCRIGKHDIKQCTLLNDEIDEITRYVLSVKIKDEFSPESREIQNYLLSKNSIILDRYVKKYNIDKYLFYTYSKFHLEFL